MVDIAAVLNYSILMAKLNVYIQKLMNNKKIEFFKYQYLVIIKIDFK